MSKDFYIKEHKVGEIKLIGACDKELLGKVIRDEKGFSIEVAEKFYGGMLVDGDELLSRIGNASSVNLVGNRIVGLFIEKGFGKEGNVITIGGVRLMMIIRI
ncbi:MAG: DUF424 domain-containing protein [Thermoproteota archaeon]